MEGILISKNLSINNEIREPQVRLVGVDGEALGIMSGKDAQELADKANLDLVMIAPQGSPPVCRIMDYGKHRFEQSKREKDQRKNHQQTLLKEVRLSLNIDDHDMNTKANHAKKFLKAGDKVKVTIRFKGREVTHLDLGRKLMERFKEACAEFGVGDEKPSKLEGRFFTTIIYPKTDKPGKMPKNNAQKPKQVNQTNQIKEETNEKQD
ncbi:MAG: translation initiation factor IF-3 [Oscillospiraceae bacterium]|nr:translation initiation factor IF-3 [Oscillospiraceae bacterium]